MTLFLFFQQPWCTVTIDSQFFPILSIMALTVVRWNHEALEIPLLSSSRLVDVNEIVFHCI